MENIVSDQDRKSDQPKCEPGDAAHAPEKIPDASGSLGSDGRADIISVCAWCPELHVLRVARRRGDVLYLYTNEEGKLDMAYRKSPGEAIKRLEISDGICPTCKARMLSGGAV
jgi:hypothetical protein